MKKIGLTRGLYALVDDEDYEYLNQWKWCAMKNRKRFYSMRVVWGDKPKTILMHRLIMNTPKGMEVDHIDHNCLNNQKNNLRNCKPEQNQMNRLARGRSKYLGVSYKKKYIVAQIKHNYKTIYLGYFKSEEDAAMAYDNKARELFGEYANLNFK